MNKTKVEVYREVLRYVSQNFQGTENFIKHFYVFSVPP